jgi:hypothetical protein
MNLMAFSPSSKSNSKIDKNQIIFGAIDFQRHPPTLASVFASLDQEMDLMIESFYFRVGSLGYVRLSDPINSGSSAGKTTIAATLETSVGSSSEVNSLVSIKTTKGSIVDELGKIMKNLDLDESSVTRIWVSTKTSTSQTAIQKRISWSVTAMSPTILKIHGGLG